jgi:hypothetical protein
MIHFSEVVAAVFQMFSGRNGEFSLIGHNYFEHYGFTWEFPPGASCGMLRVDIVSLFGAARDR